MKIISVFAITATVFLLGCSAIQSTKHTGSGTDSGLAYYLPKGLLRLTVVEEVIGKPTGQTTNQGSLTLSYTTNVISVTTDVQIVPDRRCMYVLKMKPSSMADDYMNLAVTNGLLQTITLSNSDQSIGVINNLALAAIEGYKLAATGGAGFAGAEATTNITTNIFLVDPFCKHDRTNLCNRLLAGGVTLDLTDFEEAPAPTSNAVCTPGVFYRPVQAYTAKWSSTSGDAAGLLYFPNVSPVLSLDVKRAAFVSQSYILGIHDGIPYQVVLNKPSQALAVSVVPLNLLRALTALPTNILQLRLDYSNRSSDLLKAQTAQITNLQAELATQQKFDAWLATNNPAVHPVPPAPPVPVGTPPTNQTATGTAP